MTGHPLWLRLSWRLHRLLDRPSGGRPGTRVMGIPVQDLTSRPIPVVILEPRAAG